MLKKRRGGVLGGNGLKTFCRDSDVAALMRSGHPNARDQHLQWGCMESQGQVSCDNRESRMKTQQDKISKKVNGSDVVGGLDYPA